MKKNIETGLRRVQRNHTTGKKVFRRNLTVLYRETNSSIGSLTYAMYSGADISAFLPFIALKTV